MEEDYNIKLDKLFNKMKHYINWLEYKIQYPYSAFGVYDTINKQVIYSDNGISPMPFCKWLELFENNKQ